jgi:hypothetical protein
MARTILDTRRDQIYPVLDPAQVERIRHFGHVQSFEKGDGVDAPRRHLRARVRC